MFKKLQIFTLALLISPAASYAGDFSELNNKLVSQGIGTSYINGPGVSNKQIIYNKINGNAFVEGDIMLGTITQADAMVQKQANSAITPSAVILDGNNFRWPNNLVPYQFDSTVAANVQDLINRSISHWTANTNIEFVLRTTANATQFPNFINIVNTEVACWSFVGMRGGQQNLNLAVECGFGAAVHEIGHALGLWHEQSRADRDQFVTINWANIVPGRETAFNQHITDATDIGAYDYGSIMHYGRTAFGIADPVTGVLAETITPTQNGVTIGQRNGLSTLDIAAIQQIYPAVAAPAPIADLYIPQNVRLGEYVLADASWSTGTDLTYEFNMGDGGYRVTKNPYFYYRYRFTGTFYPRVTVTDSRGLRSRATYRVTVR